MGQRWRMQERLESLWLPALWPGPCVSGFDFSTGEAGMMGAGIGDREFSGAQGSTTEQRRSEDGQVPGPSPELPGELPAERDAVPAGLSRKAATYNMLMGLRMSSFILTNLASPTARDYCFGEHRPGPSGDGHWEAFG